MTCGLAPWEVTVSVNWDGPPSGSGVASPLNSYPTLTQHPLAYFPERTKGKQTSVEPSAFGHELSQSSGREVGDVTQFVENFCRLCEEALDFIRVPHRLGVEALRR